MLWNVAALWDAVADTVGDETAYAHEGATATWEQYENRAARLAKALSDLKVGRDSKVAIYGYNSPSWIEGQYAAFKVRGTSVNVNYRYTADELIHLLKATDSEILLFDAKLAPRVDEIRRRVPKLRHVVEMADGTETSGNWALRMEDLISASIPLAPQDYSEDDPYMLCTGGTTGLPKGVLYRQGDYAEVLLNRFALIGHEPCYTIDEVKAAITQIRAEGKCPVSLPACPLMHGTGMALGVVAAHLVGGCVVTYRNERFDPHTLWATAARNNVTQLVIVGDVFAKPMAAALDEALARGEPYHLPSLRRISSSGVMFSAEAKSALLKHLDIEIFDQAGATEGSLAVSLSSRTIPIPATGQFIPNPSTKVFTEDGREIKPGTDEIGLLASAALVPLGYYGDEAKSAATFRIIDGVRYSFPGDFAKYAPDGSLILLGRGSNCINTGGEKVFAEEIEEVLKSHPGVSDCLVVGLPDERFGQRVVAVVAADETFDETAATAFCRLSLAGYKLPRQFVRVEAIPRAPNGKPNYAWARDIAIERTMSSPAHGLS